MAADPRSKLLLPDGTLDAGPGLHVLQAVVDTLMDGAPPELAAELRDELPDPLRGATRAYNAEAPATVQEFLDRFRSRAGLPREGLLHEAQIAVALVQRMLTAEAAGDLQASLPPAFDVLFRRT